MSFCLFIPFCISLPRCAIAQKIPTNRNESCGTCSYGSSAHAFAFRSLPALSLSFFLPLPLALSLSVSLRARLKSCPGEVSNACLRSAWGLWRIGRAAVLNEGGKEEGDRTLTPAGCGDSSLYRSEGRGIHWEQHRQLLGPEETNGTQKPTHLILCLFAYPVFPEGFYAPQRSEGNAAEMSVAWLYMPPKGPLS